MLVPSSNSNTMDHMMHIKYALHTFGQRASKSTFARHSAIRLPTMVVKKAKFKLYDSYCKNAASAQNICIILELFVVSNGFSNSDQGKKSTCLLAQITSPLTPIPWPSVAATGVKAIDEIHQTSPSRVFLELTLCSMHVPGEIAHLHVLHVLHCAMTSKKGET